MADTLKEYLIGVEFKMNEGDANRLQSMVNQLDAAMQSLNASIKKMQGSSMSATSGLKAEAQGAQQAAQQTSKLGNVLRGVSSHFKLFGKNSKHAGGDLKMMGRELKRTTQRFRRYMNLFAGYILGTSMKAAIKNAIDLSNGIQAQATELKKSVEDARAYKIALDAIGKSAEEIEKDENLKKTFEDLQAIGKEMALPEAAQGLKTIERFQTELQATKVTFGYAMQWVIYKVEELAKGPLKEIRELLGGFRKFVSNNMPKIATSFAKVFGGAIQLISSVIQFVMKLVGWIDQLPDKVKIAGAAAIAVIAAVQSKAALITLIVGAIVLLIDDLITYMQGGDSLFADFWGPFLEWVEEVKPKVEAFLGYFADGVNTIIEAIGWLCSALGSDLVIAIGVAATALWLLNSHPIVLVIGSVMALIAAIGYLRDHWDEVKAAAQLCWDFIVLELTTAWDTLVTTWNVAAAWFDTTVWTPIKETAQTIWNSIKNFFRTAWNAAKAAWTGAGEWFASIWETIKTTASTAWNAIKNFPRNAWNAIKGVWNAVASWFEENVWAPIRDNPVLSGLADVIAAPFRLAKTYVKLVWRGITTFFSGIWELIKGDITASELLTKLAEPFTEAWNSVTEIWNGITTFFSNLWKSLTGGGEGSEGGDSTGIVAWLRKPFDDAWAAIAGVWENVKQWFRDLFTGGSAGASADEWENVSAWLTKPFTDAWNFIKSIFNDISSLITNVLEKLGVVKSASVDKAAEITSEVVESVGEEISTATTPEQKQKALIKAAVLRATGYDRGAVDDAVHNGIITSENDSQLLDASYRISQALDSDFINMYAQAGESLRDAFVRLVQMGVEDWGGMEGSFGTELGNEFWGQVYDALSESDLDKQNELISKLFLPENGTAGLEGAGIEEAAAQIDFLAGALEHLKLGANAAMNWAFSPDSFLGAVPGTGYQMAGASMNSYLMSTGGTDNTYNYDQKKYVNVSAPASITVNGTDPEATAGLVKDQWGTNLGNVLSPILG